MCLLNERHLLFPGECKRNRASVAIVFLCFNNVNKCPCFFADRERLFSERFAKTSQFVVTGRIWQRAIPTRNCDVLLTCCAASTCEDTLWWLVSRLRERIPELSVHIRLHASTAIYCLYVTTNHEQYVTCIRLCLQNNDLSEGRISTCTSYYWVAYRCSIHRGLVSRYWC